MEATRTMTIRTNASGALAAVILISLAACSSAAAKEYESVTALRDAAVAGGYACPSWAQENKVAMALESGSCSTADVFSVYPSKAAVDQQLTLHRQMGTGMISLLVGPNWIVNTKNPEGLQKTLGGAVVRE